MEMDKIFSGVKLKSKQFCCGDKIFKIDYSDDLDAIIDQMTNEQFEKDYAMLIDEVKKAIPNIKIKCCNIAI